MFFQSSFLFWVLVKIIFSHNYMHMHIYITPLGFGQIMNYHSLIFVRDKASQKPLQTNFENHQ